MRKSITLLQSGARFCEELNSDVVNELAGAVPDETMQTLVDATRSNNYDL